MLEIFILYAMKNSLQKNYKCNEKVGWPPGLKNLKKVENVLWTFNALKKV